MTELAFAANHLARIESRAKPDAPFFVESARRLTDRLADTKRHFNTVLNLSKDGGATQRLHPMADTFPRAAAYDLILANLTLATLDDPVSALHRHLAHLKPDSLLLATTLGSGSFPEFRRAFNEIGESPIGHTTPMPDVQECGDLLQRLRLAMPVVDRDVITLTATDFPALYRNLRSHAAHNYHPERNRALATPRLFKRMEEAYRSLYPREDGRLPVTVELIYLHGWQPHKGQQKPLKPGEGKVSLVKILSTD
jgi:hypothetical protein